MSKIKAFENLPDIEVEGAETLEEAIEDCKALYAKFDKELDGTESTPLARCNEARLVLLTLAHRSHHTIEYATNALKAELLPTSTGANLDNLVPFVGTERLQAGYATTVLRFTLAAARTSTTIIPEGTQTRTADKRYFITSEYAEIPAGELTVDVPAVAVDAGADSTGIAIGEINVLVDPIPYVASVENTSVTSGGVEKEDDDSLTERAYIAPSNVSVAGPVDLYEYFARSWRSDITAAKPICEDGYTVYMAIKAYSYAKDGSKALSKNFRVREFQCKDRSDPIFIDDELVTLLQKIRDHFGKAVNINSAFRTASHNARQKKASKHSQHLYGKAADIWIAGVSVDALAAYAETLLPGKGGIGRYYTDGFVHVDVREVKSRWVTQ